MCVYILYFFSETYVRKVSLKVSNRMKSLFGSQTEIASETKFTTMGVTPAFNGPMSVRNPPKTKLITIFRMFARPNFTDLGFQTPTLANYNQKKNKIKKSNSSQAIIRFVI